MTAEIDDASVDMRPPMIYADSDVEAVEYARIKLKIIIRIGYIFGKLGI